MFRFSREYNSGILSIIFAKHTLIPYTCSGNICFGLHVSKETLISNMYCVYREYINHPLSSYTKKFHNIKEMESKNCVRIKNLFTGCRTYLAIPYNYQVVFRPLFYFGKSFYQNGRSDWLTFQSRWPDVGTPSLIRD